MKKIFLLCIVFFLGCEDDSLLLSKEARERVMALEPKATRIDAMRENWEVYMAIKEGYAYFSALVKVLDSKFEIAIIALSKDEQTAIEPTIEIKIGKRIKMYSATNDNTIIQLSKSNYGKFNKFLIPIADLNEAVKASRDGFIYFSYLGYRGEVSIDKVKTFLDKVNAIRYDEIMQKQEDLTKPALQVEVMENENEERENV